MTELSPAAQAVLDAYENSYTESGLVAALRAAADQVVPQQQEPNNGIKWRTFVRYEERNSLRIKLLAIAAELEGQ